MSYLPQLSLQKYSKLLPAVRSKDGLQESNLCGSEFLNVMNSKREISKEVVSE